MEWGFVSAMTGEGVTANTDLTRAKNPTWRLQGIALVGAAVALWWAFRGVDIREFITSLLEGDLSWLALAAGVVSTSYAIRARRWQQLVDRPSGYWTFLWATNVGYLANNFLPARAGEPLRALLLARAIRASASYVFATALLERSLDAIGIVAIASTAILWAPDAFDVMGTPLSIAAALAMVGIIALFAAPSVLVRALQRVSTDRSDRVADMLESFREGMRSLSNGRRRIAFAASTVFAWVLDSIALIVVARAFEIELELAIAIVFVATLAFASIVPSTPGYIGVYQAAAVAVLVPLGMTRPDALIVVVAIQAVTYVVSVVFGVPGLIVLRRTAACAAKSA
jgi:glycosyltransferase 2 family protein